MSQPGVTPPASVRTTAAPSTAATRVVLVRHGEAVCNVEGVVGGRHGCRGLTEAGIAQVAALAERLAATGELAGVTTLYSSVLPRALETAAILAPALDRWRDGPPLEVVADCDLCELHPGEADGLIWEEFVDRYPAPDWDADPAQPFAPGGESWAGFVDRAVAAVARLADTHPGGLVVAACHAGVVEATVLRFLDSARDRLRLPTAHASLTVWQRLDGQWTLRRYNDVTPPQQA